MKGPLVWPWQFSWPGGNARVKEEVVVSEDELGELNGIKWRLRRGGGIC